MLDVAIGGFGLLVWWLDGFSCWLFVTLCLAIWCWYVCLVAVGWLIVLLILVLLCFSLLFLGDYGC